jgi:palmitoyltransferase
MSSGDPPSGLQASGSNGSAALGLSPPSAPSGKSAATPPKVATDDASVELNSMKPERSPAKSIPLGEDIMQVARIGEVSVMQKLFDEKKFTANYSDEEGITPLHVRRSSIPGHSG